MAPNLVVLLLLAVIPIGGIVLLVALLSNEKTRPIGYALLGVGLVGVLLIGVSVVFWARTSAVRSESMTRYRRSSDGETRTQSRAPGFGERSSLPSAIDVPTASDDSIPDIPDKIADAAPSVAELPPKSEEATDSPSPTATPPTGVKPAWVDRSDLVAPDGSYETKVSVGPFQNQLQCAARLDAALIEAANQYILEFLYQGDHTDFPLRLPLSYIKRNIMTGEKYTERTSVRSLDGREMVTLHVKLRFSPEVQQVLKQRQQEGVLTAKFWYTGISVGLVLTAILALFSYLKLDTVTKGFYTRRLQFSVGVVILVVLGMGYLLQQGAVVEPLMYGFLPF